MAHALSLAEALARTIGFPEVAAEADADGIMLAGVDGQVGQPLASAEVAWEPTPDGPAVLEDALGGATGHAQGQIGAAGKVGGGAGGRRSAWPGAAPAPPSASRSLA